MPSTHVFTGLHRQILPEHYTPGENVVLIGRGRRVREHHGNIRFHALVDANLAAYENATTKRLKSSILSQVLIHVRNQSEDNLGFVKKDPETGFWCAIDDANARINIAQAFRDRLANSYRSSKQYKSIKRQHDLGLILQEEYLRGKIFPSSSIKSETNHPTLDEARPSKRMCIANQVPIAVPKADFSLGRISSSSSLDRVCDILHQARKFTSNEPPKQAAAPHSSEPPSSDALLSYLLNRFENTVDCSGSPFDPKPIAVDYQKPTAASSFEPMAMPLTASSCTLKESQQELFEYEPLPLTNETVSTLLHPSLSCSSLDFSGSELQLEDCCFDKVNEKWGAQHA